MEFCRLMARPRRKLASRGEIGPAEIGTESRGRVAVPRGAFRWQVTR